MVPDGEESWPLITRVQVMAATDGWWRALLESHAFLSLSKDFLIDLELTLFHKPINRLSMKEEELQMAPKNWWADM